MNFEAFLRSYGIDPDKVDDGTRSVMRKIYEEYVEKREDDDAVKPGEEQAQARMDMILGCARAATATATDKAKANVLEFATGLVSDEKVTGADAQRKITEKILELAKDDGTRDTNTADEQRMETDFAVARDENHVYSLREITSGFGQEREDRSVYESCARSVLYHMQHGNPIAGARLFKELEDKRGLLIIHEEEGHTPVRRTISSSSANVAVQVLLNTLLNMSYKEQADVTDQLVTIIPGGADQFTLPEVETEDGVRRLKESEPYPILGGTERDVKTGYVKYGGATSQTRENSVFDRLARVAVHMKSLARQLRRYRAEFRLARICDSQALDGRYIARPGNDNGSAVFYSGTDDHRGNSNLITSNGLADYTDLNAVEKELEAMTLLDGSHIVAGMKVMLVPSALKYTAWQILHSIFVPTTGSGDNALQKNPWGPEGMFSELPKVISHPKVQTYTGNETTWFAGDPQQQFHEVEHWPVEIVPVLTGGDAALRDIVSLWKGSFCIDLVALSNMFFIKNTA